MVYRTHIKAKVDSRLRSRGVPENFYVSIGDSFTFSAKRSRRYYMRLQDIALPLTFYNISANYNTFKVVETDGITPHTLTITIEPGNYTITELLTQLEAALDAASIASGDSNNYTLTYDITSNKVSFEFAVGAGGSTSVEIQTIASGSTLNYVLGVGVPNTDNITNLDNTLTLLPSTEQEAPNVIKLNTVDYVYITTNMTSHNAYLDGDRANIGAFIPPIGQRNEVLFYENDNGARIELHSKHPINQIQFRLLDSFGNQLDLNGQNYHFNLVIEELIDEQRTGDLHDK